MPGKFFSEVLANDVSDVWPRYGTKLQIGAFGNAITTVITNFNKFW